MKRNIFHSGDGIWPDPWFIATLFDTYFAFLTFYIWVAYKEVRTLWRAVWFVLIMLLGNLAIASYMLIQLIQLRPGDSWKDLLLRKE